VAFANVNLADVKVEKIGIPVGQYTFTLAPGSEVRIGKFSGQEELNVRFVVAEGDEKGKGIFVAYPDPTVNSKNGKSQAKFSQALKMLEIALGVDQEPGESMPDYLNRVATTTPARLTAKIQDNNYTDAKTGNVVEKTRFSIFSVGPAD
jgi:hypothetical protein